MTNIPTTILVAYDTSLIAEAACRFAVNYAKSGDHLVLATTYPEESLREPVRHKVRAFSEQLQMESARSKKLQIDFVVDRSDERHVGEAILRMAKTFVVDIIVCGSTGKSKVQTILGSVSQYLLANSDRPVVIYREPITEKTAQPTWK